MFHDGGATGHNELVDAGDGMRANLAAAVLEEGNELWHKSIDGPSFAGHAFQGIRRVLAYLLQGSKSPLVVVERGKAGTGWTIDSIVISEIRMGRL